LKFVTISDTHGLHHDLQLPTGDVLIHAGDMSNRGREKEIMDFLDWFAKQDFAHKILIAGNHDFFFEQEPDLYIQSILPQNIIYLKDSGITINGLQIWGSPVTPWFYDWAFNRHRGKQIKKHWDLIPTNTDILVTHGPAFGRLDANNKGEQVGCKDLLDAIELVRPKVHICGHIHEAYGTMEKGDTKFMNASVLNEKYVLTNQALVFSI
jgi:Icc-related predicted phosphoesterase